MEKDKLPKDEEISTEDLDQVSGGMTTLDTIAHKEFKSTAIDSLQIDSLKINSGIKW